MRIEGGQVLDAEGLRPGTVAISGGRIAGRADGPVFDADGLVVLPGLVDLHGDAFERQVQPRPGVEFPLELAFADTEAQLLASGITTAFHAVTLSWEPGLRGPAAWRASLEALGARRWTCDVRVHMRWETHNLGALPMALEDLAAGRVHLVSFNDHTPAIHRRMGSDKTAAKYADRAMMSLAEFRALAEHAWALKPEVPEATARLAAAARACGLPMASHDDDTVATREQYRALGARICEFPVGEAVGEAARAAGDAVVMGCPNVVRGGSHLGWASAQALSERGVCSVLCSDYFYPAMVAAGLRLARGPLGWAAGWATVSGNAAEAAGLDDRGRIAPGLRADLVLVEPGTGGVVATMVGGAVAHLTRDGWERVSGMSLAGRRTAGEVMSTA